MAGGKRTFGTSAWDGCRSGPAECRRDRGTFEVRSPPEFEVAFASILRKRQDPVIDAMTTVTDPMFVFDRKRIVDFGIENKIPNAHEYREWCRAADCLPLVRQLMEYGVRAHISSRRSST